MDLVNKKVGVDSNEVYVAKPLKEAKQQLDEKWDNIFNYNING